MRIIIYCTIRIVIGGVLLFAFGNTTIKLIAVGYFIVCGVCEIVSHLFIPHGKAVIKEKINGYREKRTEESIRTVRR